MRRRLRARVLAGLSLGAVGLALAVALTPLPDFAAVRADTGSDALLLDRDGEALQRVRIDRTRRQLDWVTLDRMSPALVRAVLAAEDRRFEWHPGVDPVAVAAALADAARGAPLRGASTVAMQLAGLLDDGARATRRTWPQKLAQAQLALALQTRWGRAAVLEAYLNLVPVRGELVGMSAAALALFGVAPEAIDDTQAAVLAALLRAPGASRATLARRACSVLHATAAADADAACARAAWIASVLPARLAPPAAVGDAPHLARLLLAAPGERRTSTLVAPLQRAATELLRTHVAELDDRNVEDGALVVLDNASGAVLAWVGSSGTLSRAGAVDGVTAARQPGSALKPFLYALALDGGWMHAASVLDDAPLALATGAGLYAPQNYAYDYAGPVSVRTALAGSLNVPAVRTLGVTGVQRFHRTLRTLGFDTLSHDAEHYGAGLALGGGEVTLLQLANAYRALANGGLWTPVHTTPERAGDAAAVRVFTPATAFVIGDILADRGARAGTFGLASPLATRGWAAVKTGTSKGMRDNWAVGWTDRYTVAVWVGNASGAPMWDVSGVTGAAPVWQAVVEWLHAPVPSAAPPPPAGVERRRVVFAPAVEPARDEWFAAGQAVARVQVPAAPAAARIVQPVDGTVIAPDPDIPAARQQLHLQASGHAGCLAVDGRALTPCARSVLLPLPRPGAHRFELMGADGRVLDRVQVQVRALPAPPAR